jgi:hypothetical protein
MQTGISVNSVNHAPMTGADDHIINGKIATTMVGPTVLIAAGLIPDTAIFIPLGVALYKICTHTPR